MLKSKGWAVFIVRCADDSLFSGMCRETVKKLREINSQFGTYFTKHPERLPVVLVYEEKDLVFREAYAKSRYLKEMNRKLRLKLIETKVWPIGGAYKKYLQKTAL